MTVREAAEALGVTVEAVRGKMHRGKYGREKDADGRVFVYVPADQLSGHDPERLPERSPNGYPNVRANGGPGPAEEDVERLLDEVTFLRAELAERNAALRRREELHGEEIRRRDHIIAGLVERVPAIEAPAASPEARDAPQAATEGPEGTHTPTTNGAPQEAAERRSWWRWWLGG
jgi:hypothetical protein